MNFPKILTVYRHELHNSPGLSPERVRSLEQLLLFLAQTGVSCSEILGAREGGCQGAPGQGHRDLFESRGSLFFESFVGAHFSLKILIVDKKRCQNGVRMRSCGAYFLDKMQKRKSVFRLRRRVRIACEPIPWSAQGDPKIKEKT